MGKKSKKPHRKTIWYCSKCKAYVNPASRQHHQGHPGRFGTPTIEFFESKVEEILPTGERRWVDLDDKIKEDNSAIGSPG